MDGPVAAIDRPRARPFTVGDAMILVVAVALGLAIARGLIAFLIESLRLGRHASYLTWAGAIPLGRFLNIILLNFLIFLVPACVVLRLRRPRAPLGSLVRQPGFAVCAAPTLVFLTALPLTLQETLPESIRLGAEILFDAVAPLAWACLLLTRRWRPEPGWIDRLGVVLGVLLTVSSTVHSILKRLPF